MSVRVRFAPSPTGALHIGGVRTALYNYLFAKKNGGTFILRIEDTDQNRYVPGAEDYIIESLKWLGITPDEGVGFGGDFGPYRQSERQALYEKHAHDLVARGKAYYAFDTPEELEELRKSRDNFTYNYQERTRLKNSLNMPQEEVRRRLDAGEACVIRLMVEPGQDIHIHDLIRGDVVFQSSELDDKVLLKADGMPTYHLANIVDDYQMQITQVIRGEEWLPSTAHHVLLYQAFGWEDQMPQFAHLPLILKPVGNGKLSKRDGAKFGMPVFPLDWEGGAGEEKFAGFRETGFLPAAVLNFLALLGWHPGNDQEIFSPNELVQAFSIEHISKGGARFDYEKAKWFNQQYIHASSDAELAERIRPAAAARNYRTDTEYLTQIAGLMKERVTVIPDFVEQGYYLFEPVSGYDDEMIRKKWDAALQPAMDTLIGAIEAQEPFAAPELEEMVKQYLQENGIKPGAVLPLLRLALAGTMKGPAVFEMAVVLGKAETVDRLKNGLQYFNQVVDSPAG
ncbi:MAG: glutamate--tRNA ligase [Bacteroidetes bacterium]|nr:MAG: glutamate--tRNA ligase [Bacteroidota bacterium]